MSLPISLLYYETMPIQHHPQDLPQYIRSLVISLKLFILKQIDFFFRSDDDVASATDEPQFYKEEKKNRIKMEIARRRQQIEENACLHDELTRCRH